MIDQVEIHKLAQSEDAEERIRAVEKLKNNFAILEDKEQAWDDLIRLIEENLSVRVDASDFRVCYSYLPDELKKPAWDDLIRLTQEEAVRLHPALALGVCHSHLPDEFKKPAWDDLIRLTHYKFADVRWHAASALGVCYSNLPDELKKSAWDDLHRLTQDKIDDLRWCTASSLGAFYSYLPDELKKPAWDDLIRLTQDNFKNVRISANHSSGRVSIYKASQGEGDESIRSELETALRFFEKSSNESDWFNPAKFCLPFYRSFHAITFKKEEAEAEVKQYLVEAKSAVGGSEIKGNLLEIVENLGNALNEVQRSRDLNEIKSNLNTYLKYCDRACELLDATEESAPGASRLVRKGMPIIGDRIKGIIGEIKEKAKTLCKQTKGTQLEDLGKEVNRYGQVLLQIRDPIGLEKGMNYMQITLSNICSKMPEEERREACELLKKVSEELDIEDKVYLINIILGKISTQRSIVSAQIRVEKKQDEMLARISQLSGVAERIDSKTDIVIEYVKKIETSCNQIIDDLEEGGIKLRDEDKEELKTLAADLRRVNGEQLTNFTNELIKLLGDPKLQKELEKEVPKKLVKKTIFKINEIINELGIALSAAVTAEKILPSIEEVLHQISLLSGISPGLASTLILIPLIALKIKTVK